MNRTRHLANILLVAATLALAACTPEKKEPANAHFLANTTWSHVEYSFMVEEPDDTISVYYFETIRFLTEKEGEVVNMVESNLGDLNSTIPFTYTYGNKNGVLSCTQNGETQRVHFDYNEEKDILIAPRPYGNVFHRVTEQ